MSSKPLLPTLPPLFPLGAKPFAASQVHPARLCGSRRSGRTAGCRCCNAELLLKTAEGLAGHSHAMLVDIALLVCEHGSSRKLLFKLQPTKVAQATRAEAQFMTGCAVLINVLTRMSTWSQDLHVTHTRTCSKLAWQDCSKHIGSTWHNRLIPKLAS